MLGPAHLSGAVKDASVNRKRLRGVVPTAAPMVAVAETAPLES